MDPKDLPALQRVSALPDEAVYPSDLHFPGTYDRFGRYEQEEEDPQQESLGNGEDETQAAGSDEGLPVDAGLVLQEPEPPAGELEAGLSPPEQPSSETVPAAPAPGLDPEGS